MKKHFVFDLDDTLTNSYEFNQQMFVDTFLPYLPKITQKQETLLRDLHFKSRGKAMILQFEEAVKALQLSTPPHNLLKANEKLHIDNVHKISTFDDVKDLFDLLKSKNKKIHICTNRQYGSLTKILKNNGVENYIENIISCADEGHEKPDPYCLLELVKNHGGNKNEFLYFGDSKTDHDFAHNADMEAIIIDQYLNKKKFFKVILEAFF